MATEHLLLGLVREGEGVAAGVLEKLGVSLDQVRTQTILVLSHSGSSQAVVGRGRQVHSSWSMPALGAERMMRIQAEMQNTFRIGERDPSEFLDVAQDRAYSLARSMSELLAEIARLQQEIQTLRETQS